MVQKRADELEVGDAVSLGIHKGYVIEIIRESPQVLLIHIDQQRYNGKPWVYRKRANTPVKVLVGGL
jgi:hypothetical protein